MPPTMRFLHPGQSVASICRLCFMERTQLELIFDDDRGYFGEWIEKLTSVKIVNVPNAPASLCSDCKNTLEAFDAFREMCITNDHAFKEAFDRESDRPEELNVSDIKAECDEEDQQTGVATVEQNGDSLTICEAHLEQESKDITPIKLALEDYDIQVQEVDAAVVADLPPMVQIVMNNGENENALAADHAIANDASEMAVPDSTLTVAGYEIVMPNQNIEIDSSVEDDESDSEVQHQQDIENGGPEQLHAGDLVCKKDICSICLLRASKLHVMTHKAVMVFRCYICAKEFDKMGNCSRHIKRIHMKGHWKAPKPIAPKAIAPKNARRTITFEHNCKICKTGVTKLHLKTHKARGVFVCYICKKHFDKMKNVSKHIKWHMKKRKPVEERSENIVHIDSDVESDDSGKYQEKPAAANQRHHYCKICKKYTAKTHFMTHKAKGLYVCYICRKRFEKADYVIKHIKWHSEKLSKSFPAGRRRDRVRSTGNNRLNETQPLSTSTGFTTSSVVFAPSASSKAEAECFIIKMEEDEPLQEEPPAILIDSSAGEDDDDDATSIANEVEGDDLTQPRVDSTKTNCKICEKSVSKLHSITHRAAGVFQCPVCLEKFKYFQNTSKHIRNFHKELRGKYF